jgi:outer membrane protein assembly factor BamB
MKNMCAGVLRCVGFAAWLFLSSTVAMAQVAVTTYHNDNYRSGSNPQETVLTLSNVRTQSFGKRATFAVQGYVYAQPLYVPGLTIGGTSHNVLFIATEHDQVYAFDVNSGQQLWHTNFLATIGFRYVISPISSLEIGCGDLLPEIGITGTPVIDTTTGTIYVVAKTQRYDSVTRTTTYYQTLHALDIKTGLDKVAPLAISATSPGNGTGSVGGILTFDPLVEAQRSALLLLKGQVFIAWASHCDHGNYHGYVMSFNESTLVRSGLYVDTPNGYEGGFWGSGAGPAADSGGSIYAATGNGQFDGATGFGDSVLRLTELYNSEQNPSRDRVGLAVKFTVPTIADGRVFVGAENQVVMYGLL